MDVSGWIADLDRILVYTRGLAHFEFCLGHAVFVSKNFGLLQLALLVFVGGR